MHSQKTNIGKGCIMYEIFRAEFLQKIGTFPQEILVQVAQALDTTAEKYTIAKAETALCVVGREEFIDIAKAYIVTRKTEGLADGTLQQIARVLRNFIYSMSKPIQKIQPNDIRAFLFNYQKTRNITNRSLDFIRTVICTFFKWCAAEGYIQTNPAANIRPIRYTKKQRKALSQLELEHVRRACHTERDLCIVEVLYSTGCRVSELCNIRLSDIDWQNNEIIVLGKGSKYRTVYINAKAEVAIKAYLDIRKHNSEWLVCNDRGGGQMTPANIQRIFSKIEEETSIAVTPHIMRHTMATQALTGTTVEVVQQMLGHVDIATTMIYAEVDQSRIHDAHLRSVI